MPKTSDTTVPALSLRGVSKTFPSTEGNAPVHALNGIDLDIAAGEFFAIVGPSGCGKSTLLEILAGLTEASSGSYAFDGKDCSGTAPPDVGVVFQEDASFPWLDVEKNIVFGLKRLKLPEQEKQRRLDRVLKLMSLEDFRHHYPSQLSGGMRQRVCIARMLVTEPKLILLDEPFGALDQQTRLIMGDEMLRLWRDTGATIFLITHSLDEAAMLSDRIGVMSSRPGRIIEIVETGWPSDRDSTIIEDPRFGEVNARLWRLLRDESYAAQRMTA